MRPNRRVLSNRRRREDRRVNYIPHTSNPTTGNGFTTQSTVLTTGITDWRGGNEAFSLNDDNAVAYEYLYNAETVTFNSRWVFQCKIKKDAVAPATRFPIIRLNATGGTATGDCNLGISTDGSVAAVESGNASTYFDDSRVEDGGDWWFVSITFSPPTDNTAIGFYIFPAVGANANLTSFAAATTGTITLCDLIYAPYDGGADFPGWLDAVPNYSGAPFV